MLRLLVFLQLCYFLTAFPNRDASVQVCGPKLDLMVKYVCKNRFQTPGKKRSDPILGDYGSFNDVDELSQWLEHEYYRIPDTSSQIRHAPYLGTSRDKTILESRYGGFSPQRFRRDYEYVIVGGLATECCDKPCKFSTMLEYCA